MGVGILIVVLLIGINKIIGKWLQELATGFGYQSEKTEKNTEKILENLAKILAAIKREE